MKRTLAVATMLLTTASLANAQPPRGGRDGEGRPPRPNPLMMIFDIDQDGTLSKVEIAKASDSLLKLDKDDSGTIEASELPTPPRPQFGGGRPGGGRPGGGFDRGAFVTRLMENDKNEDGKLSKDEMPERFPEQAFDRFDENGDGSITKAEIEAAMERFGQRRPGGDRRPGGEGRPEGRRGEGRRPRPEGADGERRERRPERPDA